MSWTRSHTELVFSGLHLPRPLDPATVAGFLTRLASDRDAPRVVLEVRADPGGIRHLLGCHATDVQALRRMLGDLIPGSLLTTLGASTTEPRPRVEEAGRLHLRPTGLPLRSDTHEATTRALLSSLATPLRQGEQIVVQVLFGPRRAPRAIPSKAPDPSTTLLQLLTQGERPASTETRARLKERASQAGFATTIRLGASSQDSGAADLSGVCSARSLPPRARGFTSTWYANTPSTSTRCVPRGIGR